MPVLYVLLDWLNWERALRVALLGVMAVSAASAWTTRNGRETRLGKTLVVLTATCFFAAFAFHAFLHEFLGVTPDDSLVTAALFSSDQTEAGEFIQQHAHPLAKHIIIALMVVVLFGWLVWRKPPISKQFEALPDRRGAWKPALAISIVFLLLHLIPSLRNQNPLLYFPLRYSAWKTDVESARLLQSMVAGANSDPGLNSLRCADDEPRTIVFVLGESLTRLNFRLSGYPRQTTPELDSLGEELIQFPDVVSSDPSTCPSVEKMLTPATLAQPDLWLTKPDVITMARKAGYKTFWLSNHSTDANGEIFVFASHADKLLLANKGGSRGEGSYDDVVLPALEEALRDPAPRKFVILHLLNAHPAYYFRYPKSFARFNNANDEVTRQLKAQGRWPWAIKARNYYDNAVLYSDHILKRSLDICRASGQRLAWLFVPDHGQDVAHYTNYSGHNARARSQYEILMIFWRSSSFPEPAVDAATLRARAYQTDVLDHTLLGLLGISGDYYDPRGDIFSARFEPARRILRGQPYP